MTALLIIVSVLVLLVTLYVFSLKGRANTDMSRFKGYAFAHRGLFITGVVPENSMAAFIKAKENGYGIEFDVHLTKDGTLAVMHDSSLMRTVGVERKITDLTREELGMYYLENTGETIPEFKEVLNLINGEAPLIIELKSDENNYAQLCRAVCKELQGYNGAYCLESFDPRCIRWLCRHRPKIIRGQLSENFLKHKNLKLFAFHLFLTSLCVNFLTRPDFVAYCYDDRKNLPYRLCKSLWRMQGVVWTVKNEDDYKKAVSDNEIVIFEDFLP